MTDPKTTSTDSHFSGFMFGLTLGVIGTLLLSTDEGRKVARQMLNAVSSGLEKNADLIDNAKVAATKAITSVTKYQDPMPYLPDENEPAPPPLPYLNRSHSTPAYTMPKVSPPAPWS